MQKFGKIRKIIKQIFNFVQITICQLKLLNSKIGSKLKDKIVLKLYSHFMPPAYNVFGTNTFSSLN